MNRFLLVASAALDALIATGIVLGIPLAAFSLVWLIQDGMATDMNGYGVAAAAIWLLANGVDISFSADLSALTGSTGSLDLVFSLIPLALTGVFVVMGYRAGKKVSYLDRLLPAWISIALVQVAVTIIVVGWATRGTVVHVGVDAWILPTLVFLIPFILGSLRARAPIAEPENDYALTQTASSVREGSLASESLDSEPRSGVSRERRFVLLAVRRVSAWIDTIGAADTAEYGRLQDASIGSAIAQPVNRATVSTFLSPSALAARLCAAIVAGMIAGAALVIALNFVLHWTDIVSLFESLHAGVLGVVVLSVAQLAYLPNVVLWAVSWLSGVGFAFGTGSSVSPIGTQTGPLPALPILGALPPGQLAWGFVGLVVPLFAAAVAVIVVGPRYARSLASAPAPWAVWGVTASGSVIAAAALLGAGTGLSSGSLGLGRLVDVGPNGVLVCGALIVAFAIVTLPSTAILLRRQLRHLSGVTTSHRNPLDEVL